MRTNFQLRIPTPCEEHWETMRPEEQGRYCGSCKKTVVDFTGMSDKEILSYLARASQNVCGRFESHQLDRQLTLLPFQKSRWTWWAWIITGLLSATRISAQQRPVKAIIHQQPFSPGDSHDSTPQQGDSIRIKTLPTVFVNAFPRRTGKVTVTTGAVVYSQTVKTVQKIKDTLTCLHLMPNSELTVYPNPVRRATAFSLSWRTDPGSYQLGIFNAAGALIQQRIMQVNNKEQVDLLEIPNGASAGVYIIRAVREGDKKVYTRKIVVE